MTIQKRRAKRTMGEILPGFWIGRMAGVRTIFEVAHVDETEEEWTVISILSSDSIINTVKDTLQEEQRKFGRPLVQKHVVWDLPDKSHASFLSDKLQEICHVISESLSDHTTSKGAAADVHASTNTISTVDSSSTAASSTTSRSISTTDGSTSPQPQQFSSSHSKKNCLVHCARGVSRSAAVCAAWLISAKGFSLMESLDLIRTAREQVNPNMGFLAGLKALEKCFGNIAKAQERLANRQQRKLLQQQPNDATTATLASSSTNVGGAKEKTATPSTTAPAQTKTGEHRQKQQKQKKKERARSQPSSPTRQAQPQSTKSQATQETIMDAGANISAGSDKSTQAKPSQQQRQKKDKTKERARSESSSSSSSLPTCIRNTNTQSIDEEQAANAERIEKEELKPPTMGESAKPTPTDTTVPAADDKTPGNDDTINPQEETTVSSPEETEMQETQDDGDDDTGVWV